VSSDPQLTLRRSQTGARAFAIGRDFEEAIDHANGVYKITQIALLEKLPVPTSPMPQAWRAGDKGRGIARILSGSARFDYYGTLGPWLGYLDDVSVANPFAGQAVAMEAKHNAKRKPSLPIIPAATTKGGKKRSGGGLQEHQLRAAVEAWRGFRTIAVVVWMNGPDERLIFMPDQLAAAFDDFRLGKVSSIKATAALEYPVGRHRHAGEFEDWLEPVLKWVHAGGLAGWVAPEIPK
jgi:hypothetical protein